MLSLVLFVSAHRNFVVEDISGFELSVAQLGHLNHTLATGRSFLAAANRGDLATVKSLCSKRADPRAPSSGDGTQVIGYTSGAAMRRDYARVGFRIVNVGYQLAKGKTPAYILVWMRPTKVKWDGDTALVYSPASRKIVSVMDASE